MKESEFLGQAPPPVRLPSRKHENLHLITFGIVEGHIRWCDMLRVHRHAPRSQAEDRPPDAVWHSMLHILKAVLIQRFHRRRHFHVVCRTILVHLHNTELPPSLVTTLARTAKKLAESSKACSPLPVRVSPWSVSA